MSEEAYIEIMEQPASNEMRFRYSCEGRSAGSLVGVNSTEDEKTYPTIRVLNYDGLATVLVSSVETTPCVPARENPTAPAKYRPHPNRLVGKLCRKGVCLFDFSTKASKPTVLKFQQIGIQCSKKSDIKTNLEERQSANVDPFQTGFQHKVNAIILRSIQLDRIRLCFQVFLKPDKTDPKKLIPLKPVVSDPIHDKRSNAQLLIHDTSDLSSPVCGGKKIMIFCDKVEKRDIRIRFYELGADEKIIWEDWAVFDASNVHRQVAICFQTPRYKTQEIDKPVNVFFRLQKISNGTISNSIPFQYVPDPFNNEFATNSKKRKIDTSAALYEFLEIHGSDKRQKKMIRNIAPNVAYDENVAPENSNFVASNLNAPNISVLSTSCRNDGFQSQSQQSVYQQTDGIQFQQQQQNLDYQWPQAQGQLRQPLQPAQSNIQPQHQYKLFENTQPLISQNIESQKILDPKPQYEKYNQQQYQSMSQMNMDPNFVTYLPSCSTTNYHSEAGNVCGAAGNLNSNNISGQSQYVNYQNSIADSLQMPYDVQSQAQYSLQQISQAPVIIQQFCNNNLTFNQQRNQQQNEAEIHNVDVCLLPDLPDLNLL